MPALILKFDDRSLEVPVDGKVLVGRDEAADVCIENPGVSFRHAEISADLDGECRIRDLGSTHGTFVNGRRIKVKRLSPGAELRFGPVTARFVGFDSPPVKRVQEAAPPALFPGANPAAEIAPEIKQPAPQPVSESAGSGAEIPAPAAGKVVDSDSTAAVMPVPAGLPLPRPETASNQRRSSDLLRLFVLLALANAALFIACAAWFYSRTKADLQEQLAALAKNPPASAPAQTVFEPKVAAETGDLKKQIAALRSSLDEIQIIMAASDKRSDETATRIAGIATLLDDVRKTAGAREAVPAQAVAELPSSQAELVLIKERNRLTAFADEAIATGARDPYERLWDAIEDPRLANLIHATRAEILRVQDCFINGQRVKFYGIQQHQIPVAEIFPDSAALAPAQLSDDQLIHVLQDLNQTWQTRVKAAWHLGQRRSTKVGDALVKAITSDPMLDVVAEATFSFEQVTGYHAKLFDIPPLEAWWKSYNEKAPPAKGASAKAKAKTKAE